MKSHSSFYVNTAKRYIDLSIVLITIILFSWLFILIVIVYSATFQFPIFFFQERIGRDHNSFKIIKFRTLFEDETLPLSERAFRLGNFLRFLSLDELPQLWNVVKGEMSFVGPRPLPVEYATLFSEEQKRRHDVLPGITGWAQVSGKNNISWQEKFELDLYYVNHVSFLLDVKILVKTIILVASFKKDTSLNEKKFTG